jgi:hypothetical protein
MRMIFNRFLLVVWILGFNGVVFSQVKNVYDPFGLQGSINYTGKWDDTMALPMAGRFELRWRSFEDKGLYTYYSRGLLKNGKPDGVWLWEKAAWLYTIEPGKTIAPVFNAKALKYSWQSNFKNGLPHGSWFLGVDSFPLTKSKQNNQLLTFKATFKNGFFEGTFTILDASLSAFPFFAEGMINEGGVAHGIWKFKIDLNDSLTMHEERLYKNGVLLEINQLEVLNQSDSSYTLVKLEENIKAVNEIVNNASPALCEIGNELFADDEQHTLASKKFKFYLDSLFMDNFDTSIFHYKIPKNTSFFKRIRYPLSVNELACRDSLFDFITHIDSLINKRLSYRNLSINRGRTVDLDEAISFLELLRNKSDLVKDFHKQSLEANFTYKNRYRLENINWDSIINEDLEVKGVFAKSPSYLLNAWTPDLQNEGLFASLYHYMQSFLPKLTVHSQKVDSSFMDLQKEWFLQEIEDLLTAKYDALDSVYSLATLPLAKRVDSVWVKSYIKKEIIAYTGLTDIEKAKEKSEMLIVQIDSLTSWSKDWEALENAHQVLLEYYTVFEYNPYTGKRDIEIRKKRRFIAKIQTLLLPYLDQQITNVVSFQEFEKNKLEYEQLLTYLILFANDNSKSASRLENKVRKEKSAQRIVRLLMAQID